MKLRLQSPSFGWGHSVYTAIYSVLWNWAGRLVPRRGIEMSSASNEACLDLLMTCVFLQLSWVRCRGVYSWTGTVFHWLLS